MTTCWSCSRFTETRGQAAVRSVLSDHDRVVLLDPVDYRTMVHLIKSSYLVMTDSGGLQEEAPALGKPVLVLRSVTERPEGLEAGTLRLAGVEYEGILECTGRLLDDADEYAPWLRRSTLRRRAGVLPHRDAIAYAGLSFAASRAV